jgi:hypothetical protein
MPAKSGWSAPSAPLGLVRAGRATSRSAATWKEAHTHARFRCVLTPGGNPHYKSRDYMGHVNMRHKPAHLRDGSGTLPTHYSTAHE